MPLAFEKLPAILRQKLCYNVGDIMRHPFEGIINDENVGAAPAGGQAKTRRVALGGLISALAALWASRPTGAQAASPSASQKFTQAIPESGVSPVTRAMQESGATPSAPSKPVVTRSGGEAGAVTTQSLRETGAGAPYTKAIPEGGVAPSKPGFTAARGEKGV